MRGSGNFTLVVVGGDIDSGAAHGTGRVQRLSDPIPIFREREGGRVSWCEICKIKMGFLLCVEWGDLETSDSSVQVREGTYVIGKMGFGASRSINRR